MLTVPQEFKDALKSPVKDPTGYLVLEDGTELQPDGDLQRYTIEAVGDLLRTSMSKISVSLLGEHKLADTIIDAFYGVFYDDDYHYIQRGRFNIVEAKYKKDTDTTELVGYDNMLLLQNRPYTPVGKYPSTMYEYLQVLASLVGVPLFNTEIHNGSLVLDEDYYANVEEITVRDVLEDICEVSASYALITNDGQLELRQLQDTGEVITYENMIKYELNDAWGGINSVVLSRQPQNDDVYKRDLDAINTPTTRNVLNLRYFDLGYSADEVVS